MRAIISFLLIALNFNTFAQVDRIDFRIEQRLEELNQLIMRDNSHRYLRP